MEILEQVKKDGDQSIINLTKKYDGIDISDLRVSKEEIREAVRKLPEDLKESVEKARRNIERSHAARRLRIALLPLPPE